jgi:hypothetical protein
MIRYYIPGFVGGRSAYVELDGPRARLLDAEHVSVDPFSRCAAPPLAADWAEGLGLAEGERSSFESSPRAWTRAWVGEKAPLTAWVEHA